MAQRSASSSHSAFHFEANNVSDWFEWLTHIQLCDQLREGWFGSFYFPPGEREALYSMHPGKNCTPSSNLLCKSIVQSSIEKSDPLNPGQNFKNSSLHNQQAELMRQSADTVGNALHMWLRLRDAGGSKRKIGSGSAQRLANEVRS